jgi:hypothetical protein
MSKAIGVSPSTISRIWRAHGLKPHQVKTFKVSNDPLLRRSFMTSLGPTLICPNRRGTLRGRE